MSSKSKSTSKSKPNLKSRLHPRNKNREAYDLMALQASIPELSKYIKPNKHGLDSIDFSNPKAVKILNQALLHHYYEIKNWDFPDENLSPPIPGRADYIHYMADVLCESNYGKIPMGDSITCYDIGVGASCIYPILGVVEYGWNFISSDINPASVASAKQIVDANDRLKGKIDCRLQENPKDLFYGVIDKADRFDLSVCNPPFHSSAREAQKGTRRKIKNLSGGKNEKYELNFAGISNELITDGGEHKFIHKMIKESAKFAQNCYWFSTLVSKQSNVKGIELALKEAGAKKTRVIPMGTGNKSSRIVAWTFLSKEEQANWQRSRWQEQKS